MISTFPDFHIDSSKNIKKNVSFNIQSNILHLNKNQSTSLLENMEADNISTFSDSFVENCKNIDSNNVPSMFCDAESNTPPAADISLKESKIETDEKPSVLLKNLVISLEKLPLTILNNFSDKGSENVSLEKPEADLCSNSVQKEIQCFDQNEDINATHILHAKNLKCDKDTIQTNAPYSLLAKDNFFRELKISLTPLPDDFLSLDKKLINSTNSEQDISSASVMSNKNQSDDQRKLKKSKHKVSKSKHKILKPKNRLFKISKQNVKHLANERRCDSIIPLDSTPINLEEGIILPKSPDCDQDDEVRRSLCTEIGKFDSSLDVCPSSTSAINDVPSKNEKPVGNSDNNTAMCASNSPQLSLLKADKVSSDSETDIKDSNTTKENLSSVSTKVSCAQSQNSLASKESIYLNSYNMSLKTPIVVLDRLNLVLPDIECVGMSVKTPKKVKLLVGNKSKSTAGKVQKVKKTKAKLKSNLKTGLKNIGTEVKKYASSKFSSRDLTVNNFSEDDLPLLLFADNNYLMKKNVSTSKKIIKNDFKSSKKAKMFSKFDKEFYADTPCKKNAPSLLIDNNCNKKQSYLAFKKAIKDKSKSSKKAKKIDIKKFYADTKCEKDASSLLIGNKNCNKKQNYFASKKAIKNKYKSLKKTKNFSKFYSKDLSMDSFSEDLPLLSLVNNNSMKKKKLDLKKMIKNKSKSSKKGKAFSKFESKVLSIGTPCEDDVPLMFFANNYKKKKKIAAEKKINNKSSDKKSQLSLKSVTMDHSYFSTPSSMNAELDSDLGFSTLTNIKMDHNYVSNNLNVVQSLEMQTNHVNESSKLPNKSKKEDSERKTECPNCKKMDSPHVFLKTYLNKFCSGFDDLGKKKKSLSNQIQKNKSDIETARKNQEYCYNYIINRLHTHLEETCSMKESYKKQCNQNVNSMNLDKSKNNFPLSAAIQVSPANHSYASLLPNEAANEENDYNLSEMLFDAKRSSNNQPRSKSRVDKSRLGFLAANNPLRLYNKCLASERYLLSKYEMTNDQRKKLKKMFTSMKNNAAAIEKIE